MYQQATYCGGRAVVTGGAGLVKKNDQKMTHREVQ